ncbi:rhodanese-like domain-containing protein [Actinomycetospora rhizophila]|uniref:Rhodanese-like domain-containing protein n=1 Tax=Actinomycetospora rhizophila TaxID=1416876 RepID=A0ABV9ZLG5_9PSEU
MAASATPETLTAPTLTAWMRPEVVERSAAPVVVDVRSAAEYEALHIRGSHHVPLPILSEHTEQLVRQLDSSQTPGTPDEGTPVVLVCQSGVRAEQARQRLLAAGFDNARVLDGGVPAYTAAGGDVVRGRRTWALERQVRLAAGSLVLVGLAAGRYLSPRARLLATGVGAGLTFSALTDTCAMGRLLSRLPINQATPEPTATESLTQLGDVAASRPRRR